ncbi:MAG: hypothetical protein GX558_09950 [Clostridiales bacterium]|nr:hypothetical protein [Clostridiales bacterium]
MTSRERFFASYRRQGYDRPPTHHYGTPEINAALMAALGVADYGSLIVRLGDDFRHVSPAYAGPALRTFDDGSWEGLWGERYTHYDFGQGTYPEACYLPFAGVESADELKNFRFPTADWFDYSDLRAQCEALPDFVRMIGGAGEPDFINGTARCRGVEQVLLDIATRDEVYLKLIEQRFEFVYERNERALSAAGGLIDVVCFGEDLGDQRSLIMRPQAYDELFAPYMKQLFEQAHRHGALTMMHSCGSVYRLIPRLIELGLDILEVVQVDAADMAIDRLAAEFGRDLMFCGSVSVQTVLPFGTPQQVRRAVRERKALFPRGGIVIAPTHDIQVGTPIENILAMYDEIGSLSQ